MTGISGGKDGEKAGEEKDGEVEPCNEGEKEDEEAVGPSVFVPGVFVPPEEDVKLLDARKLVVLGKAQDDSEADKAAPTVSAFARVQNSKVQRRSLSLLADCLSFDPLKSERSDCLLSLKGAG